MNSRLLHDFDDMAALTLSTPSPKAEIVDE